MSIYINSYALFVIDQGSGPTLRGRARPPKQWDGP